MLCEDSDTATAVQISLGKEISSVKVVDYSLIFTFKDGTTLNLWDDGQSCCESRYMNTDDDLSFVDGATLDKLELRDGPDVSSEDDYGCKDSQFLIVTTSKGSFTVVNYNEHNGYYGGFQIKAKTSAKISDEIVNEASV